MQADDPDAALLWEMLQAARAAVQRFVAGRSFEEYVASELIQSAVERKIEIIGEAARRVSAELQKERPEIPWSRIMAERHVLAHDYGRILHDRIWRMATIHIPDLVPLLSPLIPPAPEPEDPEQPAKD